MPVKGRQFDPGSNEVAGQLPMFMTGREILHNTHPNDSNPYDGITHGILLRQKLHESGGGGHPNSLANSIAREGVREPVNIRPDKTTSQFGQQGDPAVKTDALLNGHHRVISAAVYKPKSLIPVRWTNEISDGEERQWRRQANVVFASDRTRRI